MDDAKGQLLVIQLQNFSYSWISFSRSEKWDFFHSLVKKVTSFCCSKSDAWLLKASSCMFSHEKRVEKWVQSLLCLKVHQKENIYLCEMFKQIQKYVLVDKKVLWVSPVYPNMSLILDRLDPFNYSLSKRNKKYQVNQLLYTRGKNDLQPFPFRIIVAQGQYLSWSWRRGFHWVLPCGGIAIITGTCFCPSNKIKKVINIKLKLVLMKYFATRLSISISLDLTSLLSAQLASISF